MNSDILIRKDYKSFLIIGTEVNIIYDSDGDHNISVAMINDKIYYLGIEGNSISSAIFAWQETSNRELTVDELRQVLVDNQLLSLTS